ncbi:DUF6339 family protein [Pseudomonas asiatica]|uniref:DUF6339 family protein n=1 Tax=Pseudomonas asiatica TaxID=2219225 RepID=UPI00345DD2D7
MIENTFWFLSELKLQELRESVSSNRERYASGDFFDLELDNGWRTESKHASIDRDALKSLNYSDRSAQLDAENSIIVYDALKGMTPALAMDERVWVRLTHIECIDYSRTRWPAKKDDVDKFDRNILKHFFARGVPGTRDDNAISRLWWNMYIACLIAGGRENAETYLYKLIRSADIRQAFVERSWTGARIPLARAILNSIYDNSWASKDSNFRQLMIEINRDAGGILFEALSETDSEDLVKKCSEKAFEHLENLAQ